MIDLKSLAEGVLYDYLVRHVQDLVAYDVMEDDPEVHLLSDEDYEKVADMILTAKIDIKVTIH